MGISIILNIYTLICYKRKHYIPQNSPQLSANKLLVERRITVFVLVTFIGQLIVSIFMVNAKNYFTYRFGSFKNFLKRAQNGQKLILGCKLQKITKKN